MVGLGVGEEHAMAYLATDHCRLRWLYDLDVEKARRLAAKFEAGQAATSFEQILDDPEVQAVSIASFDDAHFQQVLAALDAGKHVFVEKPMCRSLEELAAIKQAWSRHRGNLKLSSNLVLRSAPIYTWLKEKIDRGDFGSLYAFDGEYLYGRLHKITNGWRTNVADYSVMQGGGVHLIDLLLWLTAERPTTVYATGNRIASESTSFRYKDYVAATLRCPSGMVARITANFGCTHRHQHVVSIFGTEATFMYDDAGPRLHLTRDPLAKADPVDLPTLPQTRGELIGPFVTAILNDEDLETHTQAIFDVISICAACDAALEANSVVDIVYL